MTNAPQTTHVAIDSVAPAPVVAAAKIPRSQRRGNGFRQQQRSPRFLREFANFPTKQEKMAQLAAYIKSLIPAPIKTNVEVVQCGHKLAINRPPKNNCPDCWKAYFHTNPSIVTGSQTIVRVFGLKQLAAGKGDKFAKFFQQFTESQPDA